MIAEPDNIDVYFDVRNRDYSNRYARYLKEMHTLNSASTYYNNNKNEIAVESTK